MATKLETVIWYTMKDVMQVLNISKPTVYKRVQNGSIPVHHFEELMVVSHDDLVSIMIEQQLPNPEEIIEYRLGIKLSDFHSDFHKDPQPVHQ